MQSTLLWINLLLLIIIVGNRNRSGIFLIATAVNALIYNSFTSLGSLGLQMCTLAKLQHEGYLSYFQGVQEQVY